MSATDLLEQSCQFLLLIFIFCCLEQVFSPKVFHPL